MSDRSSSSHDTTVLLAAGAFACLSLTLLVRNVNRIVPLPIPRTDGYWWTFRNVESEFVAVKSSDDAQAVDTSGTLDHTTTAIRMRDKNGRKLPTEDQIPLSVLETLVQSPVYDIRQAALAILAARYALHPRTLSNFRKSWTAEQSSWDELEARIRQEESARGEDRAARASPNLSPETLTLDPNERQLALNLLFSLDRPLRDYIRLRLPDIFAITRRAATSDDSAPDPPQATAPTPNDSLQSEANDFEHQRRLRMDAYQQVFVATEDDQHPRPLTGEDYCEIIGWDSAGDMTDDITNQPYRSDANPNPDAAYIAQAITTGMARLLERQDDTAEPPSVFEGVEAQQIPQTSDTRMIVIDRIADAAATAAQSTAGRVADAQQRASRRHVNHAMLVSIMGESLARQVAGRTGPSSPASVFFNRATTRSWRLPQRDAEEGEQLGGSDIHGDGERLGRRIARAERSGADGRGSRAVSPRTARLGPAASATVATASTSGLSHQMRQDSSQHDSQSLSAGDVSEQATPATVDDDDDEAAWEDEESDNGNNNTHTRSASEIQRRRHLRLEAQRRRRRLPQPSRTLNSHPDPQQDSHPDPDAGPDDEALYGGLEEEDSDYYDREPWEQEGMPSPPSSWWESLDVREAERFRRREAMAIIEIEQPHVEDDPADADYGDDVDGAEQEWPQWWEDDVRLDYDFGAGRARPEPAGPYDVSEEEYVDYYSL